MRNYNYIIYYGIALKSESRLVSSEKSNNNSESIARGTKINATCKSVIYKSMLGIYLYCCDK